MTKMLVAKIRSKDGKETTIKTYDDERRSPRMVLFGVIPPESKILSYEWVDTLTEGRSKWNAENSDCPIPIDL